MLSTTLSDCLAGRTGNHFLPFLWYSGEDIPTLLETIDAIHDCGMTEFTLENRGGDWFCTERFWPVMDAALRRAAEQGMRVWILDDSHVPTGTANDSLSKPENAAYRPQCLRCVAVDAAGPLVASALLLPTHTEAERLLAVSAYPRDEKTGTCLDSPLDLSDAVNDGLLMLDLPQGIWRIFFIFTADPALQGPYAHFIPMISRKAVRHLIDEVHEKLYARFSEYFGNTFAGFFSDEPGFGNCDGTYGGEYRDHNMGQFKRFYPWQDDLPRLLSEKAGIPEERLMTALPALWFDVEGLSSRLRVAYMDIITRLWQENFTCQLGQWCHAHKVLYVGHNLEDEGGHFHTGMGCGHFFRSMAGQDMAGIDVVLAQMLPGITNLWHASTGSAKFAKGIFYQYTLSKLGASLAHLTPHMQNRVLCEVMGGYGWSAGLSIMRYLFNIFLANGVNNFIPHAFSLITPPFFRARRPERPLLNPLEADKRFYLPPSFYANGSNPQYKPLKQLVEYVQRVATLLSEGVHQPDVAVYYNAEQDWANAGPVQDLDEICAALTRGGIDYDLLPADALLGQACVREGHLAVNQETYAALVLPQAAYTPPALKQAVAAFAEQGLPVVCEDSAVRLPQSLDRVILRREVFKPSIPELRFYRLAKQDGTVLLVLHNESRTAVTTTLVSHKAQDALVYEPWSNRAYRAATDGDCPTLTLLPSQLLVLWFGQDVQDLPVFPTPGQCLDTLDLLYDITGVAVGTDSPAFVRRQSRAVNLTLAEKLTRFCGTFTYEADFTCQTPDATWLEIPHCGDCAELWLNNQYCGLQLGPRCLFQIHDALRQGHNTLRIVTYDNPAYADRQPDNKTPLSEKIPMPPHGFVGALALLA